MNAKLYYAYLFLLGSMLLYWMFEYVRVRGTVLSTFPFLMCFVFLGALAMLHERIKF